jgi:F-type H+-transporting ATPase subunit delta
MQTVMDPQAAAAASVYAEALLGLADDDAHVEALAKELQALATLTETVKNFENLLATAGPQRQEELVHHIFGGRCSGIIEGLLAVMAHHGRLSLLPLLADQFRRRFNINRGCVEVTVVTARELDEPHRRALAEKIKQIAGAEPLLRTKVDASLLGGVVVRIGDREYDGSVAGALKRMRRRLNEAVAAQIAAQAKQRASQP